MAKLANLTAAVSLALAAPIVAQGALLFDPDGTGALGTYTIDKFDWAPTSILADGGNSAVQNFLANAADGGTRDTTFWVYTIAKLSTGQLGNTNKFSLDFQGSPGNEITLIAGFREQVTAASTSATNGHAEFTQIDPSSSFVKMYYDDGTGTASNQLTGAGFADGTLIFSSKIDVTGNGTGVFDSNLSTAPDLLDKFNSDDWSGQQTVTGAGNTNVISFGVDLGSGLALIDTNFFKNVPLNSFLTSNVSFNTPFTSVDPSKGFYSAAAGTTPDLTLAGGQVNIGSINGSLDAQGGPDFLFGSDFVSSVTTSVPEPTSIALIGAGLGLFGTVSARRRRTQC